MVLVISPLISLMEEQVLKLQQAGISACLLGTAQLDHNILSRIKKREFNIIYCSPEYLRGKKGGELLDVLKNGLELIAIDGKCETNKLNCTPIEMNKATKIFIYFSWYS